VTQPDKSRGELLHTQPVLLPGEEALLFTIGTHEGPEQRDIALLSLDTNQWHKLGVHGNHAHYVGHGDRDYLVYAGVDSLLAVPFDLKQHQVIGPEVKVIDNVITNPSAQFSVSKNGILIYAPTGVTAAKNSLVWINLQGEKTPLPFALNMYGGPRLSSDGSRLAVIKLLPAMDVYVCDLNRSSMTKLTTNPAWDLWPVWEPIGDRITYTSCRESNGFAPRLFSVVADGSNEQSLTQAGPNGAHLAGCWSPDRQHLAFLQISTDYNDIPSYDIWVLSVQENKARAFLDTSFNEKMPAFHPRGKWMAYVSDESGRYEVYVRRFPSAEDRRQISFNRGDEPVWDTSGQRLFFRSGNTMKVVTLEDETHFTFSAPQDLFTEWFDRNKIVANYDYNAENQRFIIVKSQRKESIPMQINVVLNWLEELKHLVPMPEGHFE